MDIANIVRVAANALPTGDHTPGINSVVLHIEMAIKHFEMGQSTGFEEYFRDTIYRCNQAFEGSVKEAYRVLSSKDPNKKTPHVIELYLESNERLRIRVLNQFKWYRQEWRNPSTHDYNLDFDENEAFLAIANICAFAKVMIDQIAGELAHIASRNVKKTGLVEAPSGSSFVKTTAYQIAGIMNELFGNEQLPGSQISEAELVGSVSGYLESLESVTAKAEYRPPSDRRFHIDMIVEKNGKQAIVEFKRGGPFQGIYEKAMAQIEGYLNALKEDEAILVLFGGNDNDYEVIVEDTISSRLIYVVRPVASH